MEDLSSGVQSHDRGYEIKGSKGLIIGTTPGMHTLFRSIDDLANLPTTVLIRGETGTGKELVAKAIHNNGKRAGKQFVAINSSAIPETLLEAELFGHIVGAFTGASRSRKGLVEVADGGTLFLDEIGDVTPYIQAKLLRLLQEREFRPVGSNEVRNVDVRVVAATNRDLVQMVSRGEFRQDLYYRLNVYPIAIPPLRDRLEDIPLLSEALLKKISGKLDMGVRGIEESALQKLTSHDWPGNIRELESVLERACIQRREGEIHYEDILIDSDIWKANGNEDSRIVSKPDVILPATVNTGNGSGGAEDDNTKGNAWYSEGVLPLAKSAIYNLNGAKAIRSLPRIIEMNRIPTQNFGRNAVVYLTPRNAWMFFRDQNESDYLKLRERIRRSELNRFLGEPFKLVNLVNLEVEVRRYGGDPDYIGVVLPKIPLIKASKILTLVILTPQIARELVSHDGQNPKDSEAQYRLFCQSITHYYENVFKGLGNGNGSSSH